MIPGWWWGAAPLYGYGRGIGSVARTPAQVGMIPLDRLEKLFDETPRWWRWLGALAEEWAVLCSIGFADMTMTSKYRRCAAQLLRLAGARPHLCPSAAETIHIRQDELGQMIGLSRSTTTMVMRSFERRGLISIGYGSFLVTDMQGLQAVLDRDDEFC